ncbi:isopropylmalate isomerase [Alkalihalobacillus alcalophilus ATCC 27647 = CGMCC 1.3604]|uniref:3-isopropylmalate dehydratase large subunit n=1 Tax=Alkalihalobacillus alcalophilus ATCC 27647 = CGMCC 1.3604 TaxID=1218173 RepID=A0A094YX46_ALKAL|nr:3-isopropylmalate dehydratase large subunit [Alkalihalobacillus alcalophilus]KGA98102.1 isopropylmalate isomerase [Alkalihalobacillus alcalophilus ATCC 27647 = CGMCC 1.3604]MED1561439.1 3-isopropylmalate dehydratase large subunit [Alkalihalobacillus alcalophilus]THG88779.1 isopropylmalate isomerase [Alkalihalobacillus alcalophilus ATCC 27647 = CGMCC 1.3604]
MAVKTIIEKIWEKHEVMAEEGKPSLLYIDLHMVHEVTSPQAFEGLRLAGRKVRRPDLTFATMDHNVPTVNRYDITDMIARKQMETLKENCRDFGIDIADLESPDNGIVHVIGPELGLTQPGKTIVCGDSHTSTHGAFGALAFGIGTSEVEHVLASQTLWQSKPKTLEVRINGQLSPDLSAKDVILAVISKFGVDVGTGSVIEFTGEAIRGMTMEERMTICNMSIEAGAKAGLISPDQVTFDYLEGRENVPKGEDYKKLVEKWKKLATDEGASYDRTVVIEAAEIEPMVTWGTNPSQGVGISQLVPAPTDGKNDTDRRSIEQALEYMELTPHTPVSDIKIQHVFIGSCTNSRISDIRAAANVVKGHKVADGVRALVVPGSQKVKKKAEEEGLNQIFIEAGFEWRDSGCSMCLSMNPDVVPEGERCASTSNRNFEGRQGKGARTHLVSPEMAAAAAIAGHFIDVRKLKKQSQANG